jgi:hypothetical protein
MSYIADKINKALPKAYAKQLAGTVKPFEGSRSISGGYDPATGSVSSTTETYTGRGVFGGYSAMEVDGQHVLATDVRLTALQSEITSSPEVGDDLAGYRVITVMQDPAGATYTLQLRGV